jgi:hypothetical protein
MYGLRPGKRFSGDQGSVIMALLAGELGHGASRTSSTGITLRTGWSRGAGWAGISGRTICPCAASKDDCQQDQQANEYSSSRVHMVILLIRLSIWFQAQRSACIYLNFFAPPPFPRSHRVLFHFVFQRLSAV